METFIVDDESKSIELVEFYLTEYFSDYTITGKYTNPESALYNLLKSPPKLLFLDINMPGLSGIDILKEIQHLNVLTIFLTAHPEYAIEAIKLNAFDYLVKPLNLNEFIRIHAKIKDQEHQFLKSHPSTITLKVSNTFHLLKKDEISHASSEGNYTTIFIIDKKPLIISKNLKKIQEEYLFSHPFTRIYQSHIININHIASLSKKIVKLKNGVELPVSKQAYPKLLKYL